MLAINLFMAKLAEKRPLFHSEADFQFAFAWQLQQEFPQGQVRLEYPVDLKKRIYLDIWFRLAELEFVIELKYKTAEVNLKYSDEEYRLKGHGAYTVNHYDFLEDLQRLEQIVGNSETRVGLAVMLTNDSTYWKNTPSSAMYEAFRFYQGRELRGVLSWGKSSQSTKPPLNLHRSYLCDWHDYSMIPNKKLGEFRYVALSTSNSLIF